MEEFQVDASKSIDEYEWKDGLVRPREWWTEYNVAVNRGITYVGPMMDASSGSKRVESEEDLKLL